MEANWLTELCGNCGLTRGAHKGNTNDRGPADACPGHQGWMDWSAGPGTVFLATGEHGHVEQGTPARKKDP